VGKPFEKLVRSSSAVAKPLTLTMCRLIYQ
jgi:hypothetical protein